MPSKTKLIFNPIANLGRAWPIASALRPVVVELGGADWAGTAYPTHATEIARQAGEAGYELVVAMGGDGTVHEVVNGLMQIPADRRPRLGVVPVGSGNDFAYAAGISSDPETALRQVMTGKPVRVDVGTIQDGMSGSLEYWINAVGIGFDTAVVIRSRRVPLFQGFGVYLLSVLQTILFDYDAFRLQVETDSEQWTAEHLLLVLCNGKREGGGFHVAPQARIDDGTLQYVGVRRISRLKMLATIPAFLKGAPEKLAHVSVGNFRKMTLHSNKPLHVHTDGEIYAGFGSHLCHLSIELLPGAIEVVR